MNKVNAEERTISLNALPEQASAHGRTWRVVDITSIFKAILDFFASLFSSFSAKKSNAAELKERITSARTPEAKKIWEELRTVNESIDNMNRKKRKGKDIAFEREFVQTQLREIETTLSKNLGLLQACGTADYEIDRLKEQLSILDNK